MTTSAPWTALVLETIKARDLLVQQAVDHQSQLRGALRNLARLGFCNEQAPWWLERTTAEARRSVITFGSSADGIIRNHAGIRMRGLTALADGAVLALRALIDRDTRVLSYSVGLRAKNRTDSSPWYARVDFDPDRGGQGPCGHPTLHCHVGKDPYDSDEVNVRVAMPWVTPTEALTWLLASVEPSLEPP